MFLGRRSNSEVTHSTHVGRIGTTGKNNMAQLNTAFSQSGLAYFPDHAIYASYVLKNHEPGSRQRWRELAVELDALCRATDYSTVAILGVGFDLWGSWGGAHRCGKPVGMG